MWSVQVRITEIFNNMALNTAQDPSVTKKTPYSRPPRGTRYVFTLNNWTQEEYTLVTSSAFTAKTRWMVVAKETGETGTPHLQGAFVLLTQTAFSTVKKLPGLTRAHLEPMHGSPQDSLAYCSKQDSAAFVYGTLPTPGKRNDLSYATERILNGATVKEVAQTMEGATVVVKFNKGLTVLRSYVRPDRTEPPKIYWLYGKTGTGKTRCSFEFASKLGDVWITSGGLQWFDGYDGQRSAIFDDFRSKGVSFPFLLQLLDRYPLSVPIKGGFVGWNPEFIFITTPETPTVTFSKRAEHIPEDIEQLLRRISDGGGGIFHFPTEVEDCRGQLELLLPRVPRGADLEEQVPPTEPDVQNENPNPEDAGDGEISLEEWLANDEMTQDFSEEMWF